MRSLVALGASVCLLSGCGSANQRGIEAMVVDRVGPVTSMSDPVIYRQGDMKKVCVIVNYANDWGEAMPPIAIIGWYVFRTGEWMTDNPLHIDDTFDCAEYAAEHGEIIDG